MKNVTYLLTAAWLCLTVLACAGCSTKYVKYVPAAQPKASDQPQTESVAGVSTVDPLAGEGFTSPRPDQPSLIHNRIIPYLPDSTRSLGTEILLSEICVEIAGKIYYELKEAGGKHLSSRVAVVSAVPLSDLKRDTEFGRVLAEYILTDLADRGLNVTELRLGKEINILPMTGEFIMSRNIGELSNNSPVLDYVVVTTFSNTRKTLIIQGRLVALQTGLIETSWRYTMPLNRELLGLFREAEPPASIAVKGVGM